MAVNFLSVTVVIIAGAVFIRKYCEYTWGKCKSKRSMKNKTVIITGANSGIGKATAEALAKRGARVILACRNLIEAQIAVDDIRRKTNNSELKIMQLDLASFESIRNFAENFKSTEERLDVLINNAGVFQCPYTLTEDGFEMQFGVNHLGHFLLTQLLMEKIKQSAPSRIVVVSSSLYKKGVIDLDEINLSSHYDKRKAYCNSNLARVLFAQQLSKHLKGTLVNVYVVSPGMVWTNLGRHIKVAWLKMALMVPFACFFIRTPYQGCQTVLHCAISEELEGESGGYYRNCFREEIADIGKDEGSAKTLWNLSEFSVQKAS